MNTKIVLLASTLALSGCGAGMNPNSGSSFDPTRQYASNGERIYFTGMNSNGQPIASQSGDAQLGMHRQMHGGSCASCHGDDRAGRRLYPRFWIKAPALTAKSLFGGDDHGDGEESGHGDHKSYDNATLGRATTEELDPSGALLSSAMPRWSMEESDLADLVTHLNQ